MHFSMNKMNQIPQPKVNSEIKPLPIPDSTLHTYNSIPKPQNNPADLVAITVNNGDGKLLEYSQHPIGIRCVINNNFSIIHGGKLQLKILDPNTNIECFIDITGEIRNKIINMITNNY